MFKCFLIKQREEPNYFPGQDELITDEAGQVFKLNTRPTDHTLLSGRKQSEVAKVNAPPYYR